MPVYSHELQVFPAVIHKVLQLSYLTPTPLAGGRLFRSLDLLMLF